MSWNMRGGVKKYDWNWDYGGISVIFRDGLYHVNNIGRGWGYARGQDYWRRSIHITRTVNLFAKFKPLGLSLKEKVLLVRKLLGFYPKTCNLTGRLSVAVIFKILSENLRLGAPETGSQPKRFQDLGVARQPSLESCFRQAAQRISSHWPTSCPWPSSVSRSFISETGAGTWPGCLWALGLAVGRWDG